jgi:hypothetical protein
MTNDSATQSTHCLSVRCETGHWTTYCRGSRVQCEMALAEARIEEAYVAYLIEQVEEN